MLQPYQTFPSLSAKVAVVGTGAAPRARGAPSVRETAVSSVNLRDCGQFAVNLKQGILFRSSQVLSATEISYLQIRSVLDLRVVPEVCQKQAAPDTGCCACLYKPWTKPAKRATQGLKELFIHPPAHCVVCSGNFEDEYGRDANVFHADLVAARMRMLIFYEVPLRVKLRTIVAPILGTTREAVMAPAVADSSKLGYTKLYRLLLDHSKNEIAKALRVLTKEENFPVLVHCMHGKDRTGLLIMLILLLCSIDPQEALMDYVQSEGQLRIARDSKQLNLASHLTTDAVLASSAHVMQHTMDYLNQKYGSAAGYAKAIGITDSEVSRIRLNLMKEAAPKDLMSRLVDPA